MGKVNEICAVYHEAEATHKNGGHTVSVDEMTGIQALEHKYPDKPVIPEKTARMEFEYTAMEPSALSVSLLLPQVVWKHRI